MAYPVLSEASLPAVPRTRFRRGRREPGDLPPLRAGSVYVFRMGGEYVGYGDRHVDLGDAIVVDATEVAVVQLRPQHLVVELALASLSVRQDFTLRTTFRCKVVDPAAVARLGLVDLDVLLASHLHEHESLATLGRPYSSAAVHEVRRLADAEIRAYWMVAPLEVTGMDISLSTVEVLPMEKAPDTVFDLE